MNVTRRDSAATIDEYQEGKWTEGKW